MRYFSTKDYSSITYGESGQLRSQGGFLHHKRIFDQNVLIMVTEGVLNINANGHSYAIGKGRYIILKAGEFHFGDTESQGRLTYCWLHFQADNFESSTKRPENFMCTLPECGNFSTTGQSIVLFHQLADIAFFEDMYHREMTGLAAEMLLLSLANENNTDEYQDNAAPKINSAAAWIRKNYYKDFKVSDLADKYGYQADYFSSLFKKIMKQSVVDYTNQIRIKASKSLLSNYEFTIKEAAYSCGFSDEKYYMRVFKKTVGMTPTQYRKHYCKALINE